MVTTSGDYPSVSGESSAVSLKVTAKELVLCSTKQARAKLSYAWAEKLAALPLGMYEVHGRAILSIACATVHDRELQQKLRFLCDTEVSLTPVSSEVLQEAIHAAYHHDDASIKEAIERLQLQSCTVPPREVVDFRQGEGDAAKLLTALIDFALARGASDLHLTPLQTGALVRLRVSGELLTQRDPLCPLDIHRQIVGRIKALAKLDSALHHKPQDGAFRVAAGKRQVALRVTVMPTVHGESVALRLLPNNKIPDFSSIAFPPVIRSMVDRTLDKADGLLLFVGPTGSGKTTTMYAAVDRLSRRNLHVITVEDPVEIEVDGLSQISINPKAGFDFPLALRSILRQDPDVILLGEIRDRESALVAHQAALTGHLLLSTVHGRSALDTLARLESLGLGPSQVTEAVRLIVYQRLLPHLCGRCKVIDLKMSREVGDRVYQPVGCDACSYTGYDGRVLAAEALLFDTNLSASITEVGLSREPLLSRLMPSNYHPLSLSIQELLKNGAITAEQVFALIDEQ